jgi:hypothetical protein
MDDDFYRKMKRPVVAVQQMLIVSSKMLTEILSTKYKCVSNIEQASKHSATYSGMWDKYF